LNPLNREPRKRGIAAKRRKTGGNHRYLLKGLATG